MGWDIERDAIAAALQNGFLPSDGIYRSDGWNVYQADKLIATCHTGHQGQLASVIATRIAELLNRDFQQFCISVAASAMEAGTVETEGLDAKHESAVAKPDARTPPKEANCEASTPERRGERDSRSGADIQESKHER